MFMKFSIIALTGLGLVLSGCNQQPYYGQQMAYQDQCMRAANPRECMQVRDAGGNVSDYLMYGLAGYMLASYTTPYGPRYYMRTNPYYHGPVHIIQSYNGSYAYVHSPNYHAYSVVHHIDVVHTPVSRQSVTTSYANSPQRSNVPQGSPIQRDPNSPVRTIFRNNPAPAPSGYSGYTRVTSYSGSSSSSGSRMFSSARKH